MSHPADNPPQSRRRAIALGLGTLAGTFGFAASSQAAHKRPALELGKVGPGGKPGVRFGNALLYDDSPHGGIQANTSLTLKSAGSTKVAPELHFVARRSTWLLGIDVANNGGARDFVLAARKDRKTGAVTDIIYLSPERHGDTVGIGRTPPNEKYRLQVQGGGAMGGLMIVRPEDAGANHAFTVMDTNGTPRVGIDNDYFTFGLRARPNGTGTVLGLYTEDRTSGFDWHFVDGNLRMTALSNGRDSFEITAEGRFHTHRMPDFTTSGAQLPHVGDSTPTGGRSGEVRVGNDKLWVNDGGQWKQIPTS